MEIKIKVLDVGDADAIIVSLIKEDSSYVILVDGGYVKHRNTLIGNLNAELLIHRKKVPDLIICTHYDADHIAGLINIVKYYKKVISGSALWIFDTSSFKHVIDERRKVEKKSIKPSHRDVLINSLYQAQRGELVSAALIKTLQQEQTLIGLAEQLGMKWNMPIAGECEIAEWGITVLGPTRTYFSELFPKALASQPNYPEDIRSTSDAAEGNVCVGLNLTKSPISKPNLGSAIFLIEVNGDKYFFAGDSGIDSMYNIADYKTRIKDIRWLKVPHHGSRNNLNLHLIELIKPKVAAISGSKYIDDDLISCMRKKEIEVYTTRDQKHLCFEQGVYKVC